MNIWSKFTLENVKKKDKTFRRSTSRKEKSGRYLKIFEILEFELSKLKLRLTMGLIELLVG